MGIEITEFTFKTPSGDECSVKTSHSDEYLQVQLRNNGLECFITPEDLEALYHAYQEFKQIQQGK